MRPPPTACCTPPSAFSSALSATSSAYPRTRSISAFRRRCNADVSDIGTVLDGRYRLEERVGVGGAGVVYRATDLERNVAVALKLLHGGGDFDRRRFDREIA